MDTGVDRKDLTTYLGMLYITGGKYKIVHHLLKMLYNNIGPLIIDVDHKAINQNVEDKVLLTLYN